MRVKKFVTIFLAVLLITSTCVVTAMGYNKTFSSGYSYSAKDSKGYAKMEYRHNTSVNAVNTYANNITDGSIKAVVGVMTKGKTTDSTKSESIATRTIASGAKSGVGTSDYRSKSTNVYYWHEVDVFGNLTTNTIVSTVHKTVG